MSNDVTLSDMRTRIRRRADMENTSFVSDAELKDWINDSLSELYDILISKDEDFYLSEYNFSTVADTQDYDLPNDFYKLRAVSNVESTGEYDIPKFNLRERSRFQNAAYDGSILSSWFRYRLMGNNIRLSPTPDAAKDIRLYYVPKVTLLTDDTDTFDYGVQPGWQEFIEIDVAIKCLEKEESDTSVLMQRKLMIANRIENMAAGRDSNYPAKIIDVTVPDWDWSAF